MKKPMISEVLVGI
jgi:D-arabinose 1-dehydrogenase-like Zn-dependent alcohol dehydrogenase